MRFFWWKYFEPTDIQNELLGVLIANEPTIRWEQSYVTDDKVYCVYTAPDAEIIREHGMMGGFPVDSVEEVRVVIGPGTAG